MAITIQKRPLEFFNVFEPVIFEFTSDEDLGVNPNDLVADLKLQSVYLPSLSYTIKNIIPRYSSGVFRVDVSGFLKSLMLKDFDFDFNQPNKAFSINNFQIGISVHPENSDNELDGDLVFDSGYIFDTSFIFSEGVISDQNTSSGYFGILGVESDFTDNDLIFPENKLKVLSPECIEICEGFPNYISIFSKNPFAGPITINGINLAVGLPWGVSTLLLNNQVIESTSRLEKLYVNGDFSGIMISKYDNDFCENTVQFRFYNSRGGFSFFYAEKGEERAGRTKNEFMSNNFYNKADKKPANRLLKSTFDESFSLSGNKILELSDLFKDMLMSPNIEVLINDKYYTCEITGDYSLKSESFDYNITVKSVNPNYMSL